MTLPIDLLFSSPDSQTSPCDYIEALRKQLAVVFDVTRTHLKQAQITNQRSYASTHKTSKTAFLPGQLVWFYAPHKNFSKGGKKKLAQPWTGPFRILRKLSPVNYEIQMDRRRSGGELVVHVDKLKKVQIQNPEVVNDADDSDN
jgi:hypothetical protein